MAELRMKAVGDATAAPLFYRIQGGVWLNYYKESGAFYLSIPRERIKEINDALTVAGLGEYPIKDDTEYANVSFPVKLYDAREKVEEKKSVCLIDVILRFSEYTFNKKKGLSKTLVDCIVSTEKRNWFAGDDFFEDNTQRTAGPAKDNGTQGQPQEEDPLPF